MEERKKAKKIKKQSAGAKRELLNRKKKKKEQEKYKKRLSKVRIMFESSYTFITWFFFSLKLNKTFCPKYNYLQLFRIHNRYSEFFSIFWIFLCFFSLIFNSVVGKIGPFVLLNVFLVYQKVNIKRRLEKKIKTYQSIQCIFLMIFTMRIQSYVTFGQKFCKKKLFETNFLNKQSNRE